MPLHPQRALERAEGRPLTCRLGAFRNLKKAAASATAPEKNAVTAQSATSREVAGRLGEMRKAWIEGSSGSDAGGRDVSQTASAVGEHSLEYTLHCVQALHTVSMFTGRRLKAAKSYVHFRTAYASCASPAPHDVHVAH